MTVLVTGGGGFLGGAMVRALKKRGEEVRSFSRNAYPDLEEAGVTQVRGDIADPDAVARAVQGCDLVFHVAAKAGVWGSYDSYYRANVKGTRHVLDACRKHGVARLVYTSSPSVVFDGRDQENVDESAPYPRLFLAHYPKTKALAEQMVNQADDAHLATVSLRPHLIWGPGDNHLVPRIIGQARAGKLRLVGDGSNRVDSVYIDNAAEAHLRAADVLAPGAPISGKNYFITNGEPLPMVDLLNGILHAAGLPPLTRSVPTGAAFAAGALFELGFGLLGLAKEPRITRFTARQLATAHWFNIEAARRDLGYRPEVSVEEGLRRLAKALAATS